MIATLAHPKPDPTPLPDLDIQVEQLWSDTWSWLWGHTIQILISSAVAGVIVLALLGVKVVGLRLCASDPDQNHWRTRVGRVLSQTKLWFVITLAMQLVASYANAPPLVFRTIEFLFTIAATFQMALWARELIFGFIEYRAGAREDATSINSAMGIIRLLLSIAIFAVAIIVILDNLGVNVTGLIAGLGIGGIAIGLAAQGIFSDLFAALSIIFDKPFRRGDVVNWDSTTGTVERIGLKSTRVRALTGEQVVISNTNLLNKELRNNTRLRRPRFTQTLALIHQTPPDMLARVPGIAAEVVRGFDRCELIQCGMTGIGPSSLDYELTYEIRGEVFKEVFDIRHRLLVGLLQRFGAEGIRFAYPTQTSFTAGPDGTLVMPYPDVKLVATHGPGAKPPGA